MFARDDRDQPDSVRLRTGLDDGTAGHEQDHPKHQRNECADEIAPAFADNRDKDEEENKADHGQLPVQVLTRIFGRPVSQR